MGFLFATTTFLYGQHSKCANLLNSYSFTLRLDVRKDLFMKQVTAILLGAGQRGADAYASYALDYPNELKFVGVAEPREDRRRSLVTASQALDTISRKKISLSE